MSNGIRISGRLLAIVFVLLFIVLGVMLTINASNEIQSEIEWNQTRRAELDARGTATMESRLQFTPTFIRTATPYIIVVTATPTHLPTKIPKP